LTIVSVLASVSGRKKLMSKIYRLPVYWQMSGFVEVKADDITDAVAIAKENARLPQDARYVEDSFEVDYAVLDEMQQDN
jgi:hypothetical protein